MVNTVISFMLMASTQLRIYSVVFVLMLVSISVSAAQIETSVDRNPVSINDSFQLTFTATESPDDDPDFSPLKQNFDIINQQKRSQLSWINGSSSKTIRWILTVMAKHSGQQHIPAIAFGDDKSTALDIMISDTTATPSITSNNDELFLEVDATPEQSYVQAQILYTVRFYQRVNIAQATLSDPILDNAVVEKLADDSQYNTQIKGVNYRVTERHYAIFPQKSGLMTIAPLVLTAQVLMDDPRAQFNSFFSPQNTQTKRILSKAIALDIQPTPATFTAHHWLPAEQLTLTQTWSNSDLHVNVGEPLTRTLTIQAKGITASQLPEIKLVQTNPSLKIYPDQAIINEQKNATGVTGIREQKIAIIPSTAGTFTLPAIEIPWFNTQTQQVEVAKLAAVTLVAVAAGPTDSTTATPDISTPDLVTPSTLQATKVTSSTETSTVWMWVSILLGFAWLLTLAFIFRSRFARPNAARHINNTPNSLKDIVNALKTACADNNPHAAQQALIQWGGITFNTTNLAALAAYCDHDLRNELTSLNYCLYAKQSEPWDGAALWRAFTANQAKSAIKTVNDDPLSPLYPS